MGYLSPNNHSTHYALLRDGYVKALRLSLRCRVDANMGTRVVVINNLVSLATNLIRQFGEEKENRAFFVDMVHSILAYTSLLLRDMPTFDTSHIQQCVNEVLLESYDITYMTPKVHDVLISLRLYIIMHDICVTHQRIRKL